ncbi:MAG TPA: hypothetical protein VHP33_12525 [Polyangiaceae bacterium]|nr:hypothetical protein [Polyangiaceae bacterium]
MLGFFHTGAVHVETFEGLARSAEPAIVTRHTVREDLLAQAVAAGKVARQRRSKVQLRELPCLDAWPAFLAGDRRGYLQQIAQQVEHRAQPGEHVMLAQASMAGAVPLIRRSDVQVFTSPELGVQAALGALQKLHQDSSVSPSRD